jgi:hypothetical protein
MSRPARQDTRGLSEHWMQVCAAVGALACAMAAAGEPPPAGSLPVDLFEGPVQTGEHSAVSYQGESLVSSQFAQVRKGRVLVQDMRGFGGGWGGNAQLFFAAEDTGSRLVLQIPAPGSARYAVDLYLTRAPDYGQLRLELEHGKGAVVFDGYSPRVEPAGKLRLGEAAADEGALVLDIRVTGRHRKSTGYVAGIDRIALVPVAPARQGAPPP